MPPLERIVVWVDPAVTNTDDSDSHGIQADGLGVNGKLYRLFSWEGRTSPEDAITRAILKAVELKAECVGIETDQGGDTWASTYREAVRKADVAHPPAFRSAKAGAGHGPKAHRQAQMVAAYERGVIIHVRGTHTVLERALRRFGVRKPYDLADAGYWAWYDLCGRRRWLPVGS
jgi:phage terminase large subunit-like protein